MDERERLLRADPAEEELDADLDPNVVDAAAEAEPHAHAPRGGRLEEALLAQEEEAALDHGSVDRIYRGTSTRSGVEAALVAQEEEAALDHGSVDRIATSRASARNSRGARQGHR